MAGPTLLAKFAMGKATTRDVEKKATKILGTSVVVMRTEAASLGADVDKLVDIPVVETVLDARR